MSEHFDNIAAMRLASDGEELAAVIAASINAAAEREGREVSTADAIAGIGPLLISAWTLALHAHGFDRRTAAEQYSALLIKHAVAVRESEGL